MNQFNSCLEECVELQTDQLSQYDECRNMKRKTTRLAWMWPFDSSRVHRSEHVLDPAVPLLDFGA